MKKLPAGSEPAQDVADLGYIAVASTVAVAEAEKQPAVKTGNWTAKQPVVEVITVVPVMASVAGAFEEQHQMEVAAGQEQLAWDSTVLMKVPVKHLEKYSVASVAVTQVAGQVIAKVSYSGQKKQVPWMAGPEAVQCVGYSPALVGLVEHQAFVQGNSVVDQVASVRIGSAGLPDDALVLLQGSCPKKQRARH